MPATTFGTKQAESGIPIENQTYCAGATVPDNDNYQVPLTGTTFSWSNSNPSVGLSAEGLGNIPSYTATNTGCHSSITAIVSITPTGNGCVGSNCNLYSNSKSEH